MNQRGDDGEKWEKAEREYLQDLDLPRAAKKEMEHLEAPISQEEVDRAIKNTALGKSPGPDGYSILYYKRFSKFLIPKLCDYFQCTGRRRDAA